MPPPSSAVPASSKTHTDAARLGAYFSLHFPFPEFTGKRQSNRQEVADVQKDAKGAAGREDKEPTQKHLLFYPSREGQWSESL